MVLLIYWTLAATLHNTYSIRLASAPPAFDSFSLWSISRCNFDVPSDPRWCWGVTYLLYPTDLSESPPHSDIYQYNLSQQQGQKPSLGINIAGVLFVCSLAKVLSNVRRRVFVWSPADEMHWLHFWRALISSFFTYSLWFRQHMRSKNKGTELYNLQGWGWT